MNNIIKDKDDNFIIAPKAQEFDKKILKKGYTLEVKSWENDGDNTQTLKLWVGEDKKVALNLLKLCRDVCQTRHNGGIGNIMQDNYEEAAKITSDYLKDNPDVLKDVQKYRGCKIELNNDEVWDNVCCEFLSEIMGNSEWYASRVYEDGSVLYSPEDLEVQAFKI